MISFTNLSLLTEWSQQIQGREFNFPPMDDILRWETGVIFRNIVVCKENED